MALDSGIATDGLDGSDEGTGVDRRRFLTYLVAAPTLTVAVRLGIDALDAEAGATPGIPDLIDLTDWLVLAAQPTVHDLVIEITEDNHIVVQLPREEVGQGILTTFAMVVAEELDARLVDVDMRIQEARPANRVQPADGRVGLGVGAVPADAPGVRRHAGTVGDGGSPAVGRAGRHAHDAQHQGASLPTVAP